MEQCTFLCTNLQISVWNVIHYFTGLLLSWLWARSHFWPSPSLLVPLDCFMEQHGNRTVRRLCLILHYSVVENNDRNLFLFAWLFSSYTPRRIQNIKGVWTACLCLCRGFGKVYGLLSRDGKVEYQQYHKNVFCQKSKEPNWPRLNTHSCQLQWHEPILGVRGRA